MKANDTSRQKKNILISCGVLLIVACLCLGVILVSGVGVTLLSPFDFSQETSKGPTATAVSGLPDQLAS